MKYMITFILVISFLSLCTMFCPAQPTGPTDIVPTPIPLLVEGDETPCPVIVRGQVRQRADCSYCYLHSVQYRIWVPEEATRLVVQLSSTNDPAIDVDLVLRAGFPVTEDEENFYFTHCSAGETGEERLTLPVTQEYPLDAGAYYIAIIAPRGSQAAFELRAVVYVKELPAPSAQPSKVRLSLPFRCYTDEVHGFDISRPAIWEQVPEELLAARVLVKFKAPAEVDARSYSELEVGSWPLSALKDVEEVYQRILHTYVQRGGFTHLADKTVEIDGAPARECVLQSGGDSPYVVIFACFLKGSDAWLITLTFGPPAVFPLYDGTFDAIVESFHFITPTSSSQPISPRIMEEEDRLAQVGRGGALEKWEEMTVSNVGPLTSVVGCSSNDVFAVGWYGTILHYDGYTWYEMNSPTMNPLEAVWACSSDDVFAVGYASTILHYNGASWTEMASPSPQTLYGVWGSSHDNVFAVGDSGTILHYGGTLWKTMSGPPGNHSSVDLYAVWGLTADAVFAVGQNTETGKPVILYYDGTNWSFTITAGTAGLYAVWGLHNNLFMVGESIAGAGSRAGTILHYDGTSFRELPIPSPWYATLLGIWGASDDEIFAVGTYGTILRFDGQEWEAARPATERRGILNAVWGSEDGDVYVVGSDALSTLILHCRIY